MVKIKVEVSFESIDDLNHSIEQLKIMLNKEQKLMLRKTSNYCYHLANADVLELLISDLENEKNIGISIHNNDE